MPSKPLEPKWIIDTREQTPLPMPNAIRGTLYAGDYSFAGAEELFSVERKSIPDLVKSVTWDRERFEHECLRLRGYRFKRLIIVGTEREVWEEKYRSKASPKAVMHSLWAFEVRYDLPVIFAATPIIAAKLIRKWGVYFRREAVYKVSQAITKAATREEA